MKSIKIVGTSIVILTVLGGVCVAQTECEKAKGEIVKIKECDGSESEWCVISEKEQCYADQVKNGRCTAGKYSEKYKGIVGISPRVLCDNFDGQ